MLPWRISFASLESDRFAKGNPPRVTNRCRWYKIVFWDGNGLCLFTKRLDQGGFIWPQADDRGGKVVLSSAQLSMLIEGIDRRSPERVWRPERAG